jgi:hypothetical protein
MKPLRIALGLALVATVGLLVGLQPAAQSQEKTIKIGLIYDFSGPFSAAGSLFNYRGAKLAIDGANDKGGMMGKYKIVRVDADAQSKFLGEGNPMRGQNERAFPSVYQVVDGKFAIVYPKAFANASPILPLPPSSPFAAR